jgi:16S rRNA (cytosine967-C5)-methyltransferase
MISPARIAAYEALSAISAGRSDLPTAIVHARTRLADDRDRALTTEIATGVQRWRGTIDYLIVQFSRRALERLDTQVLDILRMGIYQLLHLTRVPAAAVVDDAVELTRRVGKASAAGFVNGILRTVSRKRSALPLPPPPDDPADREAALDFLSVSLSHPRWLAARWYDRLGFDVAAAWMRFNNQAPAITLRANRLHTTRDDLQRALAARGVATHPGRYAPDALVVDEGNPLRVRSTDHAADFVVQDEASQLVVLLAGTSPGPRILDTCASPGGKTSAFAALLGPGDLLVACDVRGRRMELLKKTLAETGANGVKLVQADLLNPLPFRAIFTTVIIDAPCSGLGTLRRDPDIRWRRQETDLPALAAAQQRMLDHAGSAVVAGGRLVYATCSSEPEENEQVAEGFACDHPDFSWVDARGAHPQLTDNLIDSHGYLRTTPHQHQLEAFFGATFEKRRSL